MRCLVEDSGQIQSRVTSLVMPYLVSSDEIRKKWHASTISYRYATDLEQLKRNLTDAKPSVFMMCSPLTKHAGEWAFNRNNGTIIPFRDLIQTVIEYNKATDVPIRYIVLPACNDGATLINDFKETNIDIVVSKHNLQNDEIDSFCASIVFEEIQSSGNTIVDTIESAVLQVNASLGVDLTGKFITTQ